jgi:hypothetical protein
MAVAALLTDPLRTSPMAKIPGLLVFEEKGYLTGVVELSFRDAGTGEQEPVIVPGELAREQRGAWLRADEHEQVTTYRTAARRGVPRG